MPREPLSADELEQLPLRPGKGYVAADVDAWRQQALLALRAAQLTLLEARTERREARTGLLTQDDLAAVVRTLGPEGLKDAGLRSIGEALTVAIETAATRTSAANDAIRVSLGEVVAALKAAAGDLSAGRSPNATVAMAEEALGRAARRLLHLQTQLQNR